MIHSLYYIHAHYHYRCILLLIINMHILYRFAS
ncbi:Uncharacterised protein [Vibrio cholerae]|nr:Uncharacterised protein [Vibrio cholerae]CSI86983.1 Uncharacterised protein [Vibrio cholerae]